MTDGEEERRQALFAELAETGSIEARNELVESYAPLAEFFANRYKNRVRDHDDLRQAAHMALVKAVDRFDPTLGFKFSTFAGRTIDGEIKRYFRDHSWAVRMPRGIKEDALTVRKAVDELTTSKGLSPTVADLVEYTGLDQDAVLLALNAPAAMTAESIHRTEESDSGISIAAKLGEDDARFEQSDAKLTIDVLMERLSDRERTIVRLRFEDDLTQQEIADHIGISQMHVSRLLRQALEKMRRQAEPGVGA